MFERFTGGLIGIGRIVPFTYDERETMRAVLREAGTPYGDYAGVDYYWANGLRGGPVQALFRWQEEYRVYLQPPAELDPGIKLMGGKEYMDSAIRLLAPSAVHELVHLRQLISMGAHALLGVQHTRTVLHHAGHGGLRAGEGGGHCAGAGPGRLRGVRRRIQEVTHDLQHSVLGVHGAAHGCMPCRHNPAGCGLKQMCGVVSYCKQLEEDT